MNDDNVDVGEKSDKTPTWTENEKTKKDGSNKDNGNACGGDGLMDLDDMS